jgi:hypothetical protein
MSLRHHAKTRTTPVETRTKDSRSRYLESDSQDEKTIDEVLLLTATVCVTIVGVELAAAVGAGVITACCVVDERTACVGGGTT